MPEEALETQSLQLPLQVELHVTSIRCVSRSAVLPFEVGRVERGMASGHVQA